jgi:hypothetical protein
VRKVRVEETLSGKLREQWSSKRMESIDSRVKHLLISTHDGNTSSMFTKEKKNGTWNKIISTSKLVIFLPFHHFLRRQS